jgi:hypothetical protein
MTAVTPRSLWRTERRRERSGTVQRDGNVNADGVGIGGGVGTGPEGYHLLSACRLRPEEGESLRPTQRVGIC